MSVPFGFVPGGSIGGGGGMFSGGDGVWPVPPPPIIGGSWFWVVLLFAALDEITAGIEKDRITPRTQDIMTAMTRQSRNEIRLKKFVSFVVDI